MATPQSAGRALSALIRRSLFDLSPSRRSGSILALDIGSSSVKLLEAADDRQGLRILGAGIAPVPAGAVSSNVVQDAAAVAAVIRDLVGATRARARQAVTAVPGPAVIVKKLSLPAQDGTVSEAAVLEEAAHVIPDNLENVSLDFQVLDATEGGSRADVILVAVKREITASYAQAILEAGLQPVVVDVDYFALENMYELNYDPPLGKAVALVNVGARYSSINILKDGLSTFTADVAAGAGDYDEAPARQVGSARPSTQGPGGDGGAAANAPEESEPAIGPASWFLVEEIQRALSFFWTAAAEEPLAAVYLSGGAAPAAGLVDLLAERLGCPVEIADPFRRLAVDRRVDRALLEERAPALAVSVGLASRRPGDK